MNNILIDYGLIILSLVITLLAQLYINYNYKKFSEKSNSTNITGAEAARKILHNNELQNVKIEQVGGNLTDHYDPKNKVVRLSTDIYSGTSIAAVSVAAHECGHAIQDKNGYLFLRIRSAIIPIVNFASYAGYFAILIGIFFSFLNALKIGIAMELIILLFQIITLPVEFNASNRAMKQIQELGLLDSNELRGGRKMLMSAAMTYVASVASAIIQVLRLLLILRARDDD